MDVDLTESLAASVRTARAERRALRIVGGDTKRSYGRAVSGDALEVAGHRGIVHYDPTELVITARAGTPLADIEARLREHGQMFAFEPPSFGAGTTIGGVVAAGVSGPRRPFAGAVRDCVLGVKVLDGRGQILRFGGVVFKNVAGFDAFRLMAGALGCLGVLLEVSIRVTPMPRAERALALAMDFATARERLSEWLRGPLPVTGACCDGEHLHLRFSGGERAVDEAVRFTGGEDESLDFWTALRNLQLPLFRAERVWRLSVPMTAPALSLSGRSLSDWAGAQRWLVADEPAERIRAAVHTVGGHATVWRGARDDEEVFSPLASGIAVLHRRLKQVFDPDAILNRGRMYADF
jgi:glycolate oxidase FAD binding subunit